MIEQDWKAAHTEYSHRIDQYLQNTLEQLPNDAPKLKEAMAYSLFNGGKRVRPFLVYGLGQMLGLSLEQLDPCAAAIECIHAYSLVHDDLPAMDDDDLRRGKPTCHIQFDEATAILVGDALQSLAFQLLAENHRVSAEFAFSGFNSYPWRAGLNGMCGGQSLDIESTNQAINIEALETLHKLKTGALIEVTAKMVAAVALGLNESQTQALETYVSCLGLAFQVQDDILDVTGNTEALGKPQGSDESLNKSTYPKLLGIDGAKALATELHIKATSALRQLPYNSDIMFDFANYIIARNH